MDTFDAVCQLTPGTEVLIRIGEGAVHGVIEEIDEEARTVTFRSGRVVTFPEPEEEVEP